MFVEPNRVRQHFKGPFDGFYLLVEGLKFVQSASEEARDFDGGVFGFCPVWKEVEVSSLDENPL